MGKKKDKKAKKNKQQVAVAENLRRTQAQAETQRV